AAIKSFKLIENGVFKTEEITEILRSPGRHEGCSGTRNLSDNLSDLKAQVAANHKGIALVRALIAEYGRDVVHAYMHHIRDNAEIAVRDLLKGLAAGRRGPRGRSGPSGELILEATDYMDDGSPICLKVTVDGSTGDAVAPRGGLRRNLFRLDFVRAPVAAPRVARIPQVYGNTNAPPSVTASAIIYCLRCMVDRDIPLNQGCLGPVTIRIPENSLLNPSENAAVVGGNVLTSQRLCDVIFKAFGACAASQGDTNNVTFGDS
ncbi:MAG: Hydantoinase B/oxoprolinase-domain-containing protein, partial [Olpidium bornovanus]